MELKFIGTEKALRRLVELREDALPDVLAKALNDTAFNARKFTQGELPRIFDRPTDYTLRSVIVKKATRDDLRASVIPTYLGGKGIDPQRYLEAEVEGGGRRNKRSENALQRAGILPPGMQTSIPRVPYPGSDDGRGNLKGSFIRTLISYFQAFESGRGFSANMGPRKKAKMADITKFSSLNSRKEIKMVRGVQFFIANGDRSDMKNKTRHLQPGIYAKTGIHGSDIKPVLIFIRRGVYRPLLDFERIGMQADVQGVFNKKVRAAIYREWEMGK